VGEGENGMKGYQATYLHCALKNSGGFACLTNDYTQRQP